MPLLYHYCSVSAFQAIAANRTLRLSDIRLSNDAKEGRRAYDRFLEKAMNRKLPLQIIDHIRRGGEVYNQNHCILAFCASENDDMLSQWRGYADDGYGFCLGLESTGQFIKVEYNEGIQDSLMQNGLDQIEYLSNNTRLIEFYFILEQCGGNETEAERISPEGWGLRPKLTFTSTTYQLS